MNERSLEDSNELKNCNFVKTVLMLLVVIYHCAVFYGGNWFVLKPATECLPLKIIAQWLNSFHIYAFALVSGYIFYHLKHERGKYEKYGSFILNKAKRLLIPYAFISIVWVIPINLVFYDYNFIDYIKNFLLATAPSQLWFLVMLFAVFAIFHPLSIFLKEHHFWGTIVVLGLWCVGYLGGLIAPNFLQIFTALRYILFFYIGFKIRQLGSAALTKTPSVVWIATDVALFALNKFLQGYDTLILKLISLGVSVLLNIVGAIMAFVVLTKLASKIKWQDNKFFGILTKTSMPVYLFHQQLIYIVIYVFNGILNPYLIFLISLVFALSISIPVSLILMLKKPTRFLIGEK